MAHKRAEHHFIQTYQTECTAEALKIHNIHLHSNFLSATPRDIRKKSHPSINKLYSRKKEIADINLADELPKTLL